MSSSITLTRDRGYADSLRAYRVVVDGKEIGRIKNGETKTFPLEPGEHELRLKIDWCGSNILPFALPPNQAAQFLCGSNLRGLHLFLILFYILFAWERYLWIKMTHNPTSLLGRALALQDEVLKRNITEFDARYDFISACIDLVGAPRMSDQSWQTLPVSQRYVFNCFHGDILSTLINATRLGFQGCETDAYAIMRVALENLTILQYIIQSGLYDEAHTEIEGNAKQGKRFSSKFTYQTALNTLGITDRRERLRGDLSNLGNHASPSRLGMSRFEIGDKNYPKVGVSINNPRTKVVIGELASLCLFFVKITDDFLSVSNAENRGAFHKKRVELEGRHDDLKEK